MKYVFVSPFYNCQEYILKCVESLKIQTFKNFEVYFIDDMSTDNSLDVLSKAIKNDKRFNIIKNNEKKFALKNIYDCLKEININDEDVVIQLDADDWLADENSLEIIHNAYKDKNCWLTYGSYIDIGKDQVGGCCRQLPDEIIYNNQIRDYDWVTSHLKTFKYGLFRRILFEDFLDNKKEFFKTTHDLALMFPMLEMAGFNSRFISEIVYHYNDLNTLNDHKKNIVDVIENTNCIRSKAKYSCLKEI